MSPIPRSERQRAVHHELHVTGCAFQQGNLPWKSIGNVGGGDQQAFRLEDAIFGQENNFDPLPHQWIVIDRDCQVVAVTVVRFCYRGRGRRRLAGEKKTIRGGMTVSRTLAKPIWG